MRYSLLRMHAVAGMTLLIVAVVGCGDRLTYKSFSKIKINDSTRKEVRRRIGTPDKNIESNLWIYTRPKTELIALVMFDERGRVLNTQWIDPRGRTDMGLRSMEAASEAARERQVHRPGDPR